MLQDNQYYMIELYVIKDVKPEYSLEIQRRQLMERDSLHSWVDKPPGFYFIWNHPYHDRSARHLHMLHTQGQFFMNLLEQQWSSIIIENNLEIWHQRIRSSGRIYLLAPNQMQVSFMHIVPKSATDLYDLHVLTKLSASKCWRHIQLRTMFPNMFHRTLQLFSAIDRMPARSKTISRKYW